MSKLFLGLVLVGGVGCLNVQPIGPLAKHGSARPAANENRDKDVPPEPVVVPAPRPVPPAMLIVPGEVTADNAAAAAQKLGNEFEYDWKTLPPPPKTAEISRIKGGVKQ